MPTENRSDSKPTNTIVTIGDINYLWGIFLLIASARKAGMKEPFVVGVKKFTPEAERVLAQLGDVRVVHLDNVKRSLTCLKAYVMLQVETEYVTWADSDAFFTGNVSEMLVPEAPDAAHFRLRKPEELPGFSWIKKFGGDARSVPQQVLDAWRSDVAKVGGEVLDKPRYTTTGSACFFAFSNAKYRHFLEIWQKLQETVLPERDVGVTDKSLVFYPQLDESTLNACLIFLRDAPRVQETFKMDKDRSKLFVHFIARPKPWEGWTKRAFRFFDEYIAVVEWAVSQGLELPGPVPPYLNAANKSRMKLLIPWMTLKPKLAKRLKGIFG